MSSNKGDGGAAQGADDLIVRDTSGVGKIGSFFVVGSSFANNFYAKSTTQGKRRLRLVSETVRISIVFRCLHHDASTTPLHSTFDFGKPDTAIAGTSSSFEDLRGAYGTTWLWIVATGTLS